MPSVNESKIAKKFGINVREPSEIKGVCVPKDEMPKIQEMCNNYETILKKNRHRRVVDKLRNVTKLGKKKFDKNETSRLNNLAQVFRNTHNYITTADQFFRKCKKCSEIEIYAKRIEEDYEALQKKGYLTDYNPKNTNQNTQFDKNRFLVFGDTDSLNKPNNQGQNPCEDNYAEHVKLAYKTLYDKLNDAIAKAHGFEEQLKKAKKQLKDVWDRDLSDKFREIQNFFSRIEECDSALDDLAQDVKKYKRPKWIKDNFDSLKERIKMLLDYAESIKKLSSTKYLEAIFYDEGDLANAKNLTTALMGCAKRLNAFGLGIQSGSLTTEKLKRTYRDAVKEFERFSKGQDKFSFESTGNNNNAQAVNTIFKMYKKLCNYFSNLISAIDKLNKLINEFLVKVDNWKKEKNDAKRRTILFVLFGVIGALSAGIIKLSPLISALIEQAEKPPVDPMPS